MSSRYNMFKGEEPWAPKEDHGFNYSSARRRSSRRRSLWTGLSRTTWNRLLYILRPLVILFIIYEICRFRSSSSLGFVPHRKSSLHQRPKHPSIQQKHDLSPFGKTESNIKAQLQQVQPPARERPQIDEQLWQQQVQQMQQQQMDAKAQVHGDDELPDHARQLQKAANLKQDAEQKGYKEGVSKKAVAQKLDESAQHLKTHTGKKDAKVEAAIPKRPVGEQLHHEQAVGQNKDGSRLRPHDISKSEEKTSEKKAKKPAEVNATPILGEAIWEDYRLLTRYFGGMRTVTSVDRTPEYPHGDTHPQVPVNVKLNTDLPQPQIPNPYPDYVSSTYQSKHGEVFPCYLDAAERIPVPQIRSYKGSVQGFPEPVIGSYDLIGLDGNQCYDRHSRFGPYGYGYSKVEGGTGAGVNDDREGAEESWPIKNRINFREIDWADAQQRCLDKNRHRFRPMPDTNDVQRQPFTWGSETREASKGRGVPSSTIAHTAVVLRVWTGFEWTQEAILNARAMIAELSLLSGGEYRVYFLVHVKEDTIPIWSSENVYNTVLESALPKEFQGMGILWSEKQMELVYNGLQESWVMDRSIYSVTRSAHFPLQYFAHTHPEIDYFWNWEIDIRSTGSWYEMLDSLRSFARKQPRKGLWERNERFYMPSVHGTWEQFTQEVRETTENPEFDPLEEDPPLPPIWGRREADETPLFPEDPLPPRSQELDKYEWGVDEEADLITLNPLFKAPGSGWIFTNDLTGYVYDVDGDNPPRRTSIITASRLSRQLLETMHKETAHYRHTMFDEMWPATVALHHGLKAVYAPHPVFQARAWPPSMLEAVLNSGPDGESGSSLDSPFNVWNEHNFRGVTWYYNAFFPRDLWRRWWGFNVDEEQGDHLKSHGEGRMCLPPMLLHPIKGFGLTPDE